MGYRDNYEAWLRDFAEDEATIADLQAIAGDEKEIEDRFYKNLSFGTAGMRGVLGAGMNRMNVYTVRRATQGLADYLSDRAPARELAQPHGLHYSGPFSGLLPHRFF